MLTHDECLKEAIKAEATSERAYGEARRRLLALAQGWRSLAIKSPLDLGPAYRPNGIGG
jgi:hypothetical protein